MKRLLLVLLLSFMMFPLCASVETDGSFPDDVLLAAIDAIELNTMGRGEIDFLLSSYEENPEYSARMTLYSFIISYGEKTVRLNADGSSREEMKERVAEEIRNLLFYEEMLFQPSPRLDYAQNGAYSFISEEYMRKGTRLKAVDAMGVTRGLFEVTDRYDEGAKTLDPLYLSSIFPGFSLADYGEWTASITASMGFDLSVLGIFSLGRTDFIFPFVPVVSVAYLYENGNSYAYGGIGLEAYLSFSRMFPSVRFTLIEEGRIGASASILLGGSLSGFDWRGRFSVFYEHRPIPGLTWRIGYENLQGKHMILVGLGGDF